MSPINKLKSIFILRVMYSDSKIKYPTQLKIETLGYFTRLKKTEYFIKFPRKENYWFLQDYPFKIFKIEECGLDYFLMDIRERIYDRNGTFYEEKISDYHKGYPGRNPENCKFKKSNFVEFIDGRNQLNIGIISNLPPSREKVKKLAEKASTIYNLNIHPFDSSDDCYIILKNSGDHEHIHVSNVFKISSVINSSLKVSLKRKYNKLVNQKTN